MDSPLILSYKKAKIFCGSTIELLSPAKLNLYLNILGKYSNGYHRLESIFERVSLCDKIKIEIVKNPAIKIHSNISRIANKNNLCAKAAKIFKKETNFTFGLNIAIKKNIPIGAGLGGGSSNAASVLIGLNFMTQAFLSLDKLFAIGKQIGSDVNFFLAQKSFAIASGRGEKITFLEASKLRHLIIWPKVLLPTTAVYQHYSAGCTTLTKKITNANIICYALRARDTRLLNQNMFNALESSALALSSKLCHTKKILDDAGIASMVTGSGSAFFVNLDKKQNCKTIVNILPQWCKMFVVETF